MEEMDVLNINDDDDYVRNRYLINVYKNNWRMLIKNIGEKISNSVGFWKMASWKL